jgi:hypothetical protein
MSEPRGPNERRIRRWSSSVKYVVFVLGAILLAQTVADVAATRLPVTDFLFTKRIDGPAVAGRPFTMALPAPDRPMVILRDSEPAPEPSTPTPASASLAEVAKLTI